MAFHKGLASPTRQDLPSRRVITESEDLGREPLRRILEHPRIKDNADLLLQDDRGRVGSLGAYH